MPKLPKFGLCSGCMGWQVRFNRSLKPTHNGTQLQAGISFWDFLGLPSRASQLEHYPATNGPHHGQAL